MSDAYCADCMRYDPETRTCSVLRTTVLLFDTCSNHFPKIEVSKSKGKRGNVTEVDG